MGPAADVYALGAILYEMLTGRPPFLAATPLETVLKVLAEEPLRAAPLVPGCPRNLETVCLKCLRKEPRERYATAEELAEDLGRFLAGEPVRARRATARACRALGAPPAAANRLARAAGGRAGLGQRALTGQGCTAGRPTGDSSSWTLPLPA